jgi:tryptophanyl-tRNA synthetase
MDKFDITPLSVSTESSFNYEKLIEHFGCKPLKEDLVQRFEKLTGMKAHHLIRREIVFSHKDFDLILDDFESGKPIFLYTGRGPSSNMHLGHCVPFELTAYLQKAFNAICIIQLSDDEKFYFKEDHPITHYNNLAHQNIKDIIAFDFLPDRTFIFSNYETFNNNFYRVVVEMMKRTTGNQIRGTYGLNLDNSIGQLSWPCFQMAPAFCQTFPDIFTTPARCLVVMAIDQTPYFRMARDFAEKCENLGYIKPAELHTKFLSGLGGITPFSAKNGTLYSVIFLCFSLFKCSSKNFFVYVPKSHFSQ